MDYPFFPIFLMGTLLRPLTDLRHLGTIAQDQTVGNPIIITTHALLTP